MQMQLYESVIIQMWIATVKPINRFELTRTKGLRRVQALPFR